MKILRKNVNFSTPCDWLNEDLFFQDKLKFCFFFWSDFGFEANSASGRVRVLTFGFRSGSGLQMSARLQLWVEVDQFSVRNPKKWLKVILTPWVHTVRETFNLTAISQKSMTPMQKNLTYCLQIARIPFIVQKKICRINKFFQLYSSKFTINFTTL